MQQNDTGFRSYTSREIRPGVLNSWPFLSLIMLTLPPGFVLSGYSKCCNIPVYPVSARTVLQSLCRIGRRLPDIFACLSRSAAAFVRFPGLTAGKTTLRLVSITFLCKNSCSAAVKVNSFPHSTQWICLSVKPTECPPFFLRWLRIGYPFLLVNIIPPSLDNQHHRHNYSIRNFICKID